VRQRSSFREQFRRGNACSHPDCRATAWATFSRNEMSSDILFTSDWCVIPRSRFDFRALLSRCILAPTLRTPAAKLNIGHSIVPEVLSSTGGVTMTLLVERPPLSGIDIPSDVLWLPCLTGEFDENWLAPWRVGTAYGVIPWRGH
jgi:hypothetical protein